MIKLRQVDRAITACQDAHTELIRATLIAYTLDDAMHHRFEAIRINQEKILHDLKWVRKFVEERRME